ncbi:MAG TPA: HD domain-containing phosphohydrolase [Fimbriimonas sp.]|nr:HD domain-containing phosphohydrolase [Fimbriimonas sp.]
MALHIVDGGANNRGPSMADILSALSHALDMVEGQPRGHAARTAYIADRIADEIELDEGNRQEILYTSLLKDAGCSDNSARIHQIFGGDDLLTKNRVKVIDWSSKLESVKFAYANMERGGAVVQKLRRMVASLSTPDASMDALTRARCTRGAGIAKKLGFSDAVAEGVANVDEHWDGRGAPYKLSGERVPLYARIVGLAQTFEVFVSTFGLQAGLQMLQERNGKWFDPELVRAVFGFSQDTPFWSRHQAHLGDPNETLPSEIQGCEASATDIDAVCSAFAEIVDAKSDFTGQHSARVCEYSVELGRYFRFDSERLSILRRAALLHDLGKLGVSNAVLDKPGRLTEAEFAAVKLHPQFTDEILRRIEGFHRIADVASAHHERLNGSGYWQGFDSEQLDLDMRVVAVADVFDALSAERPYREALPLERVFSILDQESGTHLDPECVSAMKTLHRSSAVAA